MDLAPTEIRHVPIPRGLWLSPCAVRAAAGRDRGQLRERLARPGGALSTGSSTSRRSPSATVVRVAAPQDACLRRGRSGRAAESKARRNAGSSSPRRTRRLAASPSRRRGARTAAEGHPPPARAAPHRPGNGRRNRGRRRNSRTKPPPPRIPLWQGVRHGFGCAGRPAEAPGSRQRHGDARKLRVAAPPERGRANEAAVALLAETLRIRPDDVKLVAGRSRGQGRGGQRDRAVRSRAETLRMSNGRR